MAARSIASLTISFGLVSIPIKLYSATESTAAIQFKLLGSDGARLRQQYVSDPPPAGPEIPVAPPPAAAPAGFRPKLVGTGSQPAEAEMAAPVTPAPADSPRLVERSEMLKGYEFEKGKFVTFTADELKALQEGPRETIDIELVVPSEQELRLAQQLIAQCAAEGYEPGLFVDEEKKRILAAVEGKIAGGRIVSHEPASRPAGGQIIDLVDALRASLATPPAAAAAAPVEAEAADARRKPVKRSDKPVAKVSKARPRQSAA